VNFLIFFKRFYKPVIALFAVIVFFISYNTYLVDHSLDSLRLALTQTASAQTLEDTQALKTIIDYALISEMTAYKMNSSNLADLTSTRNIVTKGKSSVQIKDMEGALKDVIRRREKQRGIILTAADRLVEKIKNLKNKLAGVFKFEKPRVAVAADLTLLEKARVSEEAWKLPEAIENYELFIATYPDYMNIDNVRLRLAYCYEQSKDYTKAQKLYERIVRLSPGTKEAPLALAALAKIKEIQSLLLKKGELSARIAGLKTTTELQDAYFQLGTLDARLLDFSSAQENYKKVVELNPDTELALKAKFNLGWAYKFQNKIEESSTVFQAIAQESPKSDLAVNSQYQVADNLKIQNKYEEALNVYKQISEEGKDKALAKQAQMQAGYTYLYDLNNPDAAKKEFDKIIMPGARAITKDIGKEHRLRGYALLKDKRYNEAVERFETAIKLNSKDTSAYDGISRVYAAMGKLDEAIKIAEEGTQIDANDEFLFATLGELYQQTGRYDEAINAYRQAVKIRYDYIEALYNLGFLYNITQQYDEAIVVLERAVKIQPSFSEAYNNLGAAYLNKGRTEEAIKAFKAAIRFNPNYLDALYNLGLTLKSEGQYSQAEEIFRRVLKISPQDLVAKKALEELGGR